MVNELARMYQGCKTHAGTYTIEFIFHRYKPKDRRATYVRAVCGIIPQKIETHITIINVGGNLIDYTGEFSTPTSDLTTMKMHVNSVISEIKSQYMFMDVKYFYLNNCVYRVEYIMILISMIQKKII